VIAERNLVRLPRAPDLLLAFTVQPIMFVLLFRYVFGGAIQTPGYSYVDFLIPGIIVQNIAFGGFVTALGLNEDVHKGLIDLVRLVEMCSTNPAKIFGLSGRGTLIPGSIADITLIDPEFSWTYSNADSRSKSRNTPFDGRQFRGAAVATFISGKLVYRR